MFKEKVIAKYQIQAQDDVWFHGRTVDSEVFDLKYVGRDEAKDQEGLFLEKMISLGYDGHRAARTEQHIIMYNPKAIKVIKKEQYKVCTRASTTEDDFYTRNQIDPDDLCFAGSGDFGEAYHAGKKRILKKTTSKSEYEFAKKIMSGHYPSFVKIYDVDEVKDGTTHHSYYILQDELNIDQDDESMFHQLLEMLGTQGVPIAYISHFDESEYEEKIDDNMLEFINAISEIVRSYNRLGIEAPDIRSENLGRDKQGRLLAFDVDEKKR